MCVGVCARVCVCVCVCARACARMGVCVWGGGQVCMPSCERACVSNYFLLFSVTEFLEACPKGPALKEFKWVLVPMWIFDFFAKIYMWSTLCCNCTSWYVIVMLINKSQRERKWTPECQICNVNSNKRQQALENTLFLWSFIHKPCFRPSEEKKLLIGKDC